MTQPIKDAEVVIRDYHVHLYYDAGSIDDAISLADRVSRLYPIKVGTFHQKPVGPHPMWSCQLTVLVEHFGDLIPWLLIHRGCVDLFIHPNTGDDLADHTNYAMWIGQSYQLKLSIFREKSL